MKMAKYPEWIEFEGVRYQAKLTKKRLTIFTGQTRTAWSPSSLKSTVRDCTVSFDTSVPDYGDGHWYDMRAIGHDYGPHKIPHVLDPHDPPPASEAVLERLAGVVAALERREKAKAEEAARRKTAETKAEVFHKWADKSRRIENAMRKAAAEGDFDAVLAHAREYHEWEAEKPSLR